MLSRSEKWDHYLTGTFYGLLSIFGVVGGREAARALWVTRKKIILAWQEKLPLGNLKTVSWPHVVAEDPVMLFVRTELARAALMSGKTWRIVFFSFCSMFPTRHEWRGWKRMVPGKMDIKPTAEGRVEVCYVPPPEMPSRLCARAVKGCSFYLRVSIIVTGLSLVAHKWRGVGGYGGEPANSWEPEWWDGVRVELEKPLRHNATFLTD